MQFRDILRRSARSLRSAKARTLLTALAIAVGTYALTLTLAASNGAQSYANTIISSNFDPSELIVTKDANVLSTSESDAPQEYDSSFSTVTSRAGAAEQIKELDDSDLTRLRATAGVASVRTATQVSLQYITRPGMRKYIATIAALGSDQNPELLAGSISRPLATHTLVLPEGFLADLGFSSPQAAINQKVTLSVQQSGQVSAASLLSALTSGNTSRATTAATMSVDYTIAAVSKKPSLAQPGTGLYLYGNDTDTTALQDYATQGTTGYHRYLSAYVKVADGTDSAKLNAVQSRLKQDGYGAQSVKDTEQFLTQIITVLQGIVSAFGVIALIASLFGIINTMYISVLQRTREIGLMKALGMSQRSISTLFRIEAALIGFVGGAIGSGLAVLTGFLLNPWITKQLGLGKDHLLIFEPLQIVVLIAALMVVATIAGLLPARKAAKLDPIEALRIE